TVSLQHLRAGQYHVQLVVNNVVEDSKLLIVQ
ncbi:MAG: hypothetical protein AUK63_1992, partial [bacterium P3]